MTTRMNSRTACALVLGCLVAVPSLAEVNRDFRAEVAVSGNADDNVFRTAEEQISGYFASLSFDSRFKHDLNKRVRFVVELDAEQDEYEGSLDNADATELHFDFGTRFTPLKHSWRWVRVTPRVFADMVDKVFNSRRTGDEISDEQDRFDYKQAGFAVDVEFRRSRLFETGIRLQAKRKDYDEDFEDDPLTDSLDYEEYRAGVYAKWRLDRSTFTVLGEYRDRDYDEKFPRARDGSEVLPFFPPGASEKPYEPSRYVYSIAGFEWRQEISDEWRVKGMYEWVDRSDEFLSYMDYRSQDFDLRLFGDIGQRWRLYGSLSYERFRYDNARVAYDPERELKRISYTRATVRMTCALRKRTELFASYRMNEEDNRDPVFAYTRHQFGLGLRHEFSSR